MGDLFHEDIIPSEIAYIFDIMNRCPQHTFYVLTKRPQNIEGILYGRGNNYFLKEGEYLPNVWLGVTAENQGRLEERLYFLSRLHGWKKFISVEPMLEEMSFRWAMWHNYYPEGWRERGETQNHLDGIKNISWVICGAESGANRRECRIEWVRNLKNQCVEAGVPFFYKQGIGDDGKWRKMPSLDGRVWNQILKG